jgi:aminoglycoside phosphotransferase family enzyme
MSNFTKLDEKEKFIIKALKSNPDLKDCFLEMLNITDGENFDKLKTGDDAEEAVVEVIQKTGKSLLQEWVEKKAKKAEKEIAQDKSYRVHEKKKSNGKLQ